MLPSAVKLPSGHLPHSPAAHSMLHLRSIPLLSAFPPPSGCRQIPRLQSSPQNCQCDCWLRHPSESEMPPPVLPSAVKQPSALLPHSPAERSWHHPPSDPRRSAPARLPARSRSPGWPRCYPSESVRQLPEKRPATKPPSASLPPSGCQRHPRLRSSPQNCQCDCWQRHPSESEMPPPVLPSAVKQPSALLPHSPAERSWHHPPSDPRRSAPARLPARSRSPGWPRCYPSESVRQLPEKRPATKPPSASLPPSGCQRHPRLQSPPQRRLQSGWHPWPPSGRPPWQNPPRYPSAPQYQLLPAYLRWWRCSAQRW